MKKIFCVLLALLCICTLFACGTPKPDENGEIDLLEGYSLLNDKKFRNGFAVRGLGDAIYRDKAEEESFGSDKYGVIGNLQYGKTDIEDPFWRIAQWSTRYSLTDTSHTSFVANGNNYTYTNTSKTIKVNTDTGEFSLGLKASECYVYGDRVFGQDWPHFLIERDLTFAQNPSAFCKVSDKKAIAATVQSKMVSFTDNMNGEGNPGLHAAQLLFYVYVSNYNAQAKAFDDMIWLGIPIFDNRHEAVPQADFVDSGTKGSATEKYIYNLGSNLFIKQNNSFYKNGQILQGEDAYWVDMTVDILPYIKSALTRAQSADCMLKSSFDNLYINGMYIGYELPGNYDIEMEFKGMDIRVYEKE